MGVCKITDIAQSVPPGSSEKQTCYVLKPLYQNCVIITPIDTKKVFIRPVITKDEAECLIESIPSISAEAYMDSDLRQLEAHYQASIKTHCCVDLIRLSMSIYMKKQLLRQQKRKFGAIEERYMKRAEDLLFGELSAALCISKDEVPSYIAAKVNAISQ